MVALADVVKDHLDTTAATFKVAAARAYYGPDAGRQLAQSAVDAVVVETPTSLPTRSRPWPRWRAGKRVCRGQAGGGGRSGVQGRAGQARSNGVRRRISLIGRTCRARLARRLQGTGLALRASAAIIGRPVLAQVFLLLARAPVSQDSPARPAWSPGAAAHVQFLHGQGARRRYHRGAEYSRDRRRQLACCRGTPRRRTAAAGAPIGAAPVTMRATPGTTSWCSTTTRTACMPTFSSNQLTGSFSDLCVRVFGIDGCGCADSHYGGLVRIAGKNACDGRRSKTTRSRAARWRT